MTDYPIGLTVQKNICVSGSRVGDYVYNEDTDTLYFELPYPFPCKFAIRELEEIIVTPMMLSLPSFLKYHNIAFIRDQLKQIKCIKDDALLLHASAWSENGHGYLAVGFPNCGKTSAVLTAVSNGAEFCSDENVIYRAGIAHPVVKKTSLSPWVAKNVGYPLTRKQRFDFAVAKVKSKLMPIFEPNIWVDLPYPRKSIRIHEILFLTHGKDESLLWLTDNEFPFYTNPVIQAYAYATGFNLRKLYDYYKELILALRTDTEC